MTGDKEVTTTIPQSLNQYFNQYAQTLTRYHKVIDLGGHPAIDISNKPHLTTEGWPRYANALVGFLTIGQREGWIRLHVTRTGHTLFLLIDLEATA